MIDDKRYRTVDVPVRGGDLRVGVWDPVTGNGDSAAAPTVLAVHGVTASHRCWSTVAGKLPEFRVIAPDMRGRGRSRDLPGPYGMAQHADDLAAVLDHLSIDAIDFVGHSMGAWMVLAASDRHPDRVSSIVLVDGGIPLFVPPGLTPDELTTAILGPAKQRLSMTFPDRGSYQDFFRAHPAFAGDWTDAVTDYVDYDLVGEPPRLQSATRYEAMAEDSLDLYDNGDWLPAALHNLAPRTPFLRAQRGMLGAEPGLYPPEWAAQWQQQLPNVDIRDVLGVNHYTILFSEIGADAVAGAVRSRR